MDRRRCIAILFGAGMWHGVGGGAKSASAKTSELVGRLDSDMVAQVLPIRLGYMVSNDTVLKETVLEETY